MLFLVSLIASLTSADYATVKLKLSNPLIRTTYAVSKSSKWYTAGPAAYSAPGMEELFHVNSLFIGPNVRDAVQDGRADFTPISLGAIPRLFREGYLPIDVALISVSPPDEHGFCSYGVEVGVTKPAVESARIVIAEINPNMPRVWGQSSSI